jgi:uncharacterized SAM-binding protein YcdF (DUF218 family)
MFFIASKIFDFILSPFTWIILLLIAAITVKKVDLKKKLILGCFILLLFFSNPLICNSSMEAWEMDTYAMDKLEQPYDVAIVLGGSMRYFNYQTKRPVYSQSVDRLMQTIALYKSGRAKKILLSGGSGMVLRQEEKESEILVNVLMQAGVPTEDIIVERESRNTFENARNSSLLLKKKYANGRFLLVTSAFHMRRSLACFKKAGLHVTPFPVDEKAGNLPLSPDTVIVPDASCLVAWDALFHEWFGMLFYRFAGYI